MERTSSVLANP
jgi:peptide-methionine (S)-S-oxide reductase